MTKLQFFSIPPKFDKKEQMLYRITSEPSVIFSRQEIAGEISNAPEKTINSLSDWRRKINHGHLKQGGKGVLIKCLEDQGYAMKSTIQNTDLITINTAIALHNYNLFLQIHPKRNGFLHNAEHKARYCLSTGMYNWLSENRNYYNNKLEDILLAKADLSMLKRKYELAKYCYKSLLIQYPSNYDAISGLALANEKTHNIVALDKTCEILNQQNDKSKHPKDLIKEASELLAYRLKTLPESQKLN